MTLLRRNFVRATLATSGLALALATAACSSDGNSSETDHSTMPSVSTSPSATEPAAAGVSATVGSIEITGAFLRQPVMPTAAAAYMTITNTGDADDTLVKATTDVTMMVEPMKEFTTPDGKKGMAAIPALVIPAGESVAVTPGHKHLMLMKMKRQPQVGETITMTLTFAKAGTVKLTLPVRALIAAEEAVTPAVETPEPSMEPSMQGMDDKDDMSNMHGMH